MVRNYKVRVAAVDDAPAMGRVMVESFLSAHRGHMPDGAFEKRVAEWTPEVSAAAWARVLAELADADPHRDVVLVAEEHGGLLGLVSGGAAERAGSGTTCEIGALYVHPQRRGQGIGRALLRAAAGHLADLGYTELHIGVLSANTPARAFYEAMGGLEIGQGTDDEEGYLLPLTIYGWADVTDLDPADDEANPPPTVKRTRPE
jgi:ribosomal protein S18 acetylase RimI-like enzyme